jgi:hypothetical protein
MSAAKIDNSKRSNIGRVNLAASLFRIVPEIDSRILLGEGEDVRSIHLHRQPPSLRTDVRSPHD